MVDKRFKETYPNIIRSNYHFTDNGEGISDKEVCDLLNQFNDEIMELKEQLDNLRTFDEEEFVEVKHINNIYKESGFMGVIDYAKDKLQEYGLVKEVEDGLWVIVTGGWSMHEYFIDCLNNPVSIFGMKHYCGYERGGAFYYTMKPYEDISISIKKRK